MRLDRPTLLKIAPYAALALFVLAFAFVAWRTSVPREPTADEIRARAQEQMNRIEARVRELEAESKR